ncbi:MAG: SGNH/GDSL hydrolase family protein [Actinobacteria bacterium]|nr:SGNH/GDSL hydrolase family protein [Actinomycetota bacterium]
MPVKGLRRVVIALVPLFALMACACMGCGGDEGSTPRGELRADDADFSHTGEDGGDENGDTVVSGEDVVYMCGRSVLGGWFEHWGWDYDYENPVRFGPYDLVYEEMDVPPGIVDTAIGVARAAAESGGGTLFFKFCFEDFVGGDEYGARENLEDNMRMVGEVAEAVVGEEGLTLIVGNALPMVREYSDEWLVWNHREYNRFLEELADAYGGRVIVLDLYGTLSTSGGWLRPEYAADAYDSHLNDAAYDALDAKLAEILH